MVQNFDLQNKKKYGYFYWIDPPSREKELEATIETLQAVIEAQIIQSNKNNSAPITSALSKH